MKTRLVICFKKVVIYKVIHFLVYSSGVIDGIFGRQTKESWETTTMEILNKYGESLLDIVAKDTCQGPCIARVSVFGG